MLAVAGCSSAATSATSAPRPSAVTSTPTPSGSPCVTSADNGECGPYDKPDITNTTAETSIGNNVYSPISGATSILTAHDPGDWVIAANMPAGNTGVVSYPSLSVPYGLNDNTKPQPLSDFSSMISSFNENMNANGGTSAWAAYDIFTHPGNSYNDTGPEVMIQTDFAHNGACTFNAVAKFGGANGVPVQTWGLCVLGNELVWKLAPGSAAVGSSATINEPSGSVDILSMLTWMETKGYMARGSGIGAIGYGWEIASTGGVSENFQVNGFSMKATMAS